MNGPTRGVHNVRMVLLFWIKIKALIYSYRLSLANFMDMFEYTFNYDCRHYKVLILTYSFHILEGL